MSSTIEEHAAAIDEVRAATAGLIAAAREADPDRLRQALARRGLGVSRLAALQAGGGDLKTLDDQAREALSVLVDLREGARQALDHLSRSAAAIRTYEHPPSGGRALDQSA